MHIPADLSPAASARPAPQSVGGVEAVADDAGAPPPFFSFLLAGEAAEEAPIEGAIEEVASEEAAEGDEAVDAALAEADANGEDGGEGDVANVPLQMAVAEPARETPGSTAGPDTKSRRSDTQVTPANMAGSRASLHADAGTVRTAAQGAAPSDTAPPAQPAEAKTGAPQAQAETSARAAAPATAALASLAETRFRARQPAPESASPRQADTTEASPPRSAEGPSSGTIKLEALTPAPSAPSAAPPVEFAPLGLQSDLDSSSDGKLQALRTDPASVSVEARVTPTGTASGSDTAARISPQIVDAIRQTRDGAVDVSLSPEELGRVRLVLQNGEAGLQVSVQAERPETMDLLRRHITQLHAELTQLGYKDVAFNFGQSGAGGTGRDETDALASAAEDIPGTANGAPVSDAARIDGTRRLDLRL